MQTKVLGNFIDGRFSPVSDPSGSWTAVSPADLSDSIGEFAYSFAAVDRAVESARGAFRKWRSTSFEQRSDFLRRYQSALVRRKEEMARTVSRETGKPLWEATAEVSAMIHKVELTLSEGLGRVSDFSIPQVLENTTGSCRYRPHGVMAVIGPYNFPGLLPNGHLVPALATGNTVVFKPSEKAPLIAQMIAECIHEAGFPVGVFNLVQGEREVGRRLCVHEDVDGVLFTGSSEVGTRIKQDTLLQHWKILVLEMGAKNASIVWSDADFENAVQEVLIGAFVTAGQRCSATSRVLVHRDLLDRFIERLHERAKAFSIGHPWDEPFMGPLIDSSSVDRYMKFLGIASREGCEIVMRGKALDLPKRGHYVTPSICWVKGESLEQTRKSVYQQTELFSPNVAVLAVDDLDLAIAQANATQYGLVASVFSRSRSVFERCLEAVDAGLINWNKSTVGASSRLPFGGVKKSGNHFPTALLAPLYTTLPVSSLEVSEPGKLASFPGLK